MSKNITKITEEQRDYLERLAYETGAYKDLLASALRLGLGDTPGYEKEMKLYAESYAAYETAKREVVEGATGHRIGDLNWEIDFGSCTLTYEVAR